jgi:hypothetical protein
MTAPVAPDALLVALEVVDTLSELAQAAGWLLSVTTSTAALVTPRRTYVRSGPLTRPDDPDDVEMPAVDAARQIMAEALEDARGWRGAPVRAGDRP